ncbi:MAG: imidazole glycerol phosphate synthase subunit HisH [Lachnospiraceae bacterium]|nr:imidazole glycerol phosphate synthase subunit HisH [Lachnospiraceae bacterium]
MIALIDYDAGNIKSVEKAVEKLGYRQILTKDAETILNCDKIILPGVGAFGDAMKRLRDQELVSVIKKAVKEKIPFLGICLGLQLLFEDSEESAGVEGIGILKGHIRRIPAGEYRKIPHMGWNSLTLRNNGRLFRGIDENAFVYFVHSYYLDADDKTIVKAVTDYNTEIDASVEQENVFACQFHPEKSGAVGLRILKNFLEL